MKQINTIQAVLLDLNVKFAIMEWEQKQMERVTIHVAISQTA